MTVPYTPLGLVSATPQGVMSIPEAAGAANDVVKQVMRVEPMIAGMAGMFVPGLSLVQPWIIMLAPFLERALDDISKGNNGDVLASFLELMQHVTKGKPNSLALTPDSSPLASQLGSPSLGGAP